MELLGIINRMESEMPRPLRDFPPSSVLHIINRGVERRDIFMKAEDYGFFMSQTREAFGLSGIALLNFALMPNHFHFQAVTGTVQIGVAMQQLETRYSLYFNRRYNRVGALFQGRYKAFECTDEEYIVDLPVYISRNPVKAGIVKRPQDWGWSGHNEIVAGRNRFLDLAALDKLSWMTSARWRANYLRRIERAGSGPAADADLDAIIRHVAVRSGVPLPTLLSGAHGPWFTHAKRQVLLEGLQRGFTLTDIAEALGCTPAALSQIKKGATPFKRGA